MPNNSYELKEVYVANNADSGIGGTLVGGGAGGGGGSGSSYTTTTNTNTCITTTTPLGPYWTITYPNGLTIPNTGTITMPNTGTVTMPNITTAWTYPAPSIWPEDLPNTIGLLFVKDGKIMMRTDKGEDVVLATIDESQKEIAISLMAIIAKKVLEKAGEVKE